jgi:hypothetical protein
VKNRISSFINKFRKCDLKKIDYTEVLEDVQKVVVGIPFPVVSLWQNEVIERIRNNYNGEIFYNINSISLREDVENITEFGRANTPNKPVFYGTLGFKNQDHARITTVVETHKTLRTKNINTEEQQIFTSGRWIVKGELQIILLPFHELTKNIRLTLASDHFTSGIQEQFSSYSEEILDLLHFFSTEFAKEVYNHNDYKLTAAFTDVFLNSYGLDGIVYPSVKSEFKTENIAIKKKSLSKIELLKAAMFELFINKDQVF